MEIFSIRKRFIIAQSVVFLLALSYEYGIGKTHDYTVILLYSLWNAISYLWLFIKELKYAPDFHPYQILALVTAQFIGFSGVSSYFELVSGETLYFGATAVNDSMYLGIIYLSLQHLLLFAIFYYQEFKHRNDFHNQIKLADRIKNSAVPYYKWALCFYLFVWFMRIISLVVPLASISSVLVGLAKGGYIVSLFLLVFAMIQKPEDRSANRWHWIIVAVEIAMVMNHGMKEEIIRTLVPYCVYILIMFKAGYTRLNSKTIVQVGAIAAFVVLFVFPYVSIFRSISISSGRSWDQISTTEALSEYGKYVNKEGIYASDDEERGSGYLMSRAGSIGCNAFSIDYAKKNGTSPEFLAYCGYALIPRIIWPDKPAVVIGGMAYGLSTGDSNWLDAGSADSYGNSVSLGYIGSCYFSLGLFGAFALIILQSFFIWWLWYVLRNAMLYNIVALWAFSGIIFILLKDFESFADCGFNFIIFNLLYVIICKTIYKGPAHLLNC